MSACTPTHAPSQPLADLRLPGVTKLAQLSPFLASNYKSHTTGFATYAYAASTAPGETHLLMILGDRLYDAAISGNGTSIQPVELEHHCTGGLTVTTDSRWAACTGYAGLEVFSLRSSPALIQYQLLPAEPSSGFGGPSWSPDGRYLAVAQGLSDQRSIAIYEVTADRRSVREVAWLALNDFTVLRVMWSPDGKWIVFDGFMGPTHFSLYGLSLDKVLSFPTPNNSETTNVSLSRADLLDFGSRAGSIFAWRPNSTVLTFVDAEQRSLIDRDVKTGQESVLLTQNAGYICNLSWVPDGTALLFQLCGPSSTDVYGPPSQVYVYRPGDS